MKKRTTLYTIGKWHIALARAGGEAPLELKCAILAYENKLKERVVRRQRRATARRVRIARLQEEADCLERGARDDAFGLVDIVDWITDHNVSL